jgi:nucleotide-binding universal stress UspA family protein
MIVIGARGQSPTKRLLLGSVSQKVARHAPCSVLVTRPSPSLHLSDRPLRILVGYDGSGPARQAVDLFSRFHWGEHVEITLLNVVTLIKNYGFETYQKSQPIWDESRQQAKQAAEQAVAQLKGATTKVRAEVHEAESVADEILASAERLDSDLIVLGHRGLNAIQRFLLGSTSEGVLRHAPCSVWIVRQNVDDSPSSSPSAPRK